MLGFTEKVLASALATMEQIGKALVERYFLSVEGESLRDILDDLVDLKKAIRYQEMYKRMRPKGRLISSLCLMHLISLLLFCFGGRIIEADL